MKMNTHTKLGITLSSALIANTLGCMQTQPVITEQSESTIAKPNILFLFADDQRPDSIAALGHTQTRTPNIDSLVSRGTTYTQNYCLGANAGAVSMPSRAMLNTGRSYFTLPNQRTLEGAPVLGELLQKNGYTTFGTGKWHNKENSFIRSFSTGEAVFLGGMSDQYNVKLNHYDPSNPENQFTRYTDKRHSSEIFADAAIDFLKTRDKDKPYFAYVSFTAPHDPRQSPTSYRSKYIDTQIKLPSNFMTEHPFDTGEMTIRDEQLATTPRIPSEVKSHIADYYAMIEHLDSQIGRILNTLKEQGELDNTIIIYSADHGLSIGSHGLMGKQNLYEQSMSCPLIFAGPNIPVNQKREAFTYLLDLFPTICSLTNTQLPENIQGIDLTQNIVSNQMIQRSYVFNAYKDVQRSIRNNRFKLIIYPQSKYIQLFDLVNDPDEVRNIAENTAYKNIISKLTSAMLEEQVYWGDTLKLSKHDILAYTPAPQMK
ncbi:sulfatase-like hydrolase/transferase [Planctomycetota bacterium]|nr:sulfatase-like hydrolase/transferase [Planctomycetota bacterium]